MGRSRYSHQDLSQPHQPSQESPSLHGQDITQTPTYPEDGPHRSQTSFQQQTSLITPHTNTRNTRTRNQESTRYHANAAKSTSGKQGEASTQELRNTKTANDKGTGTNQPLWNTHNNNNTRSTGKTAASSHPFHTGIPDEFEKPSRSYNTTQFHKIAGYTSTTSGTLSCRKHIIKHCLTQVHNQLNIKSLYSRLQPTHKSSSHSPEDGQHRLTEISRHLLNLLQFFSELPHGATASFTSSSEDTMESYRNHRIKIGGDKEGILLRWIFKIQTSRSQTPC